MNKKARITMEQIAVAVLAIIILVSIISIIYNFTREPSGTLVDAAKITEDVDVDKLSLKPEEDILKESALMIKRKIIGVETLLEKKQYDQAEDELREILKMYEGKTNIGRDYKKPYVEAYLVLSDIFLIKKNYNGAVEATLKAYKLFDKYGFDWIKKEERDKFFEKIKDKLMNTLLIYFKQKEDVGFVNDLLEQDKLKPGEYKFEMLLGFADIYEKYGKEKEFIEKLFEAYVVEKNSDIEFVEYNLRDRLLIELLGYVDENNVGVVDVVGGEALTELKIAIDLTNIVEFIEEGKISEAQTLMNKLYAEYPKDRFVIETLNGYRSKYYNQLQQINQNL